MNSPRVEHVSKCFIKPKREVEESSKQPYYLSPWDMLFLSIHYNQKGLLFAKPKQESFSIDELLDSLKTSLEHTLVHFYPLAGQFVTTSDVEKHQCLVFVDCNKGPGVEFIHASLELTVSDILSPDHVPAVVKSLFDHSTGQVVNHDGHSKPLLTIQVTELVDGVFIGCSMNHVVVDGMAFWHFWRVWSELHRANENQVSYPLRLPVHKRWIPDGYGPADISLPYTSPTEFICRFEPPELKERFFHFTTETMSKLKAKANEEATAINCTKVSSFQALVAFVWKSMIRAKGLPADQVTHCKLAANNRSRVNPPLPQEYFGNSLSAITSTATVNDLLQQSLRSTALLLHQTVVNHTDQSIHDFVIKWFESPYVFHMDKLLDIGAEATVQVGSSPRFEIYENEFSGIGKPVAVRSGFANKFGGKVIAFPGCEGGGSVDLEICLPQDSMRVLESDDEFMSLVS